MTKAAPQYEPEPIEVEFEPSYEPQPRVKKGLTPPPLRSRAVTLPQLLVASVLATALGAVMAIGVTNANSGASTGTLARELDELANAQAGLLQRTERMSADMVSIRSRLESQGEQLGRQEAADLALRGEIATVASQLSALIGAGPGQAAPGASAANTPLGALLARLNRLETILTEDAASPQTTRQVQRSVIDLKAHVEQLYQANAQLTAALDQRQASIRALEEKLQFVSTGVARLQGEDASARELGAGLGLLRPLAPEAQPALARIPRDPQTIRTLSLLELAADRGASFVAEQQSLALLLPHDPDVALLSEIAPTGAPAEEELRSMFEATANGVEAVLGSQEGWAWLRKPIPAVIRSSGGAVMPPLTEMRRMVEAGDMRGAAQLAGAIPAPASAMFGAWRTQVMRRAELDRRLAGIRERMAPEAPAPTEG